MTEGAVE